MHGYGLATELCGAATSAAHRVDPDKPVVAVLLEHNRASKVTAKRAGLTLTHRGPDTGNPDPDATRLIYADRPLDQSTIRDLTKQTV